MQERQQGINLLSFALRRTMSMQSNTEIKQNAEAVAVDEDPKVLPVLQAFDMPLSKQRGKLHYRCASMLLLPERLKQSS
jgi:hypothetical protein